MNSRHYLPGELRGIESARQRGYVACTQFDDDLAMDWYGVCRDEGMPFVQCAVRRKYHVIDYDLAPFIAGRPGIEGLSPNALDRVQRDADAAAKSSPNRQARAHIESTSGVISGIPRDDAHQLARRIATMFRDLNNYELRIWEGDPA